MKKLRFASTSLACKISRQGPARPDPLRGVPITWDDVGDKKLVPQNREPGRGYNSSYRHGYGDVPLPDTAITNEDHDLLGSPGDGTSIHRGGSPSAAAGGGAVDKHHDSSDLDSFWKAANDQSQTGAKTDINFPTSRPLDPEKHVEESARNIAIVDNKWVYKSKYDYDDVLKTTGMMTMPTPEDHLLKLQGQDAKMHQEGDLQQVGEGGNTVKENTPPILVEAPEWLAAAGVLDDAEAEAANKARKRRTIQKQFGEKGDNPFEKDEHELLEGSCRKRSSTSGEKDEDNMQARPDTGETARNTINLFHQEKDKEKRIAT
eukprot:g11754.t1